MAEPPVSSFAGLLKQLRTDTKMTQEELAARAGPSPRSISDLERGIHITARTQTAELLAAALGLTGSDRAAFEAAARGRPMTGAPSTPGQEPGGVAAATRTLPRGVSSFTGRERELSQLLSALAERVYSGLVTDIYAIGGMAGIGKTAFVI